MKTATIHATEFGFGGFRATVLMNGKTVASQLFKAQGWGSSHADAAYAEAKKWLAGFGLN